MSDVKTAASHPGVNPETAPYWAGTADGKLLVKHCSNCGENHFYPRAICPFCHSFETDWKEASGRGRIYSYSVMRRANPVFVVAYVTLEEGPSMFTNLVGFDHDAIAIGADVQVQFVSSADGLALPVFGPA